ncbi:MAG: MltA domain-containing protein [Phycisphaerales bacterium]|nr:MltA domain-containing protein [Phycisphaerales bacterium]
MLMAAAFALLPVGCKQKQDEPMLGVGTPDYGRPLGPGESALRLITDPARMPDLVAARRDADFVTTQAIDRSLTWFAAPSSRQFYPFEDITHERARQSLVAFRELLETEPDPQAFESAVRERFDIYESVGYDNRGTVLFTGYYSPVFAASRVPTARFTAPLYMRPDDLVTDPVTGEPKGRLGANGTIGPYPTRREIESSRMFLGRELVWLETPLDAYIVQVNGSAKLRMPDGSTLFVGYAGKTDQPYTGLGSTLVERGYIDRGSISLRAIQDLYRQDPKLVEDLILVNDNFVFFTTYPGDRWPAGSLGVKVSDETTLATDKKIYPRGGVVMVETRSVTFSSGQRDFKRLMLDQDTGGAIRAPGRADIFMGVGPSAEILAGGQYAEGRLFYFFLKQRYLDESPTNAGDVRR